MSVSPILDAFGRRKAGHKALLADPALSDVDAAPLWADIDAADAIIGETVGSNLAEIESQIWTVLHAADAFFLEDAEHILDRDFDYVVEHKANCDWQFRPLIAALQGLRTIAA